MRKEVMVLIAEDDEGHATLIKKNLKRAGILNELIHFHDGQEVLDYLFRRGDGPGREPGKSYLLLLDIRMPKVDGIEVLRQVKADPELKKVPVIMITTTDDPREVERCHSLGCSNYVTKPIDYDKFVKAIRQLGLFLMVVEVPVINGTAEKL
ncbi:MAG: response regulator [Chitinivibrionales bacterium]|nr:response regulator [Chitinivibrionales bacterium]MBD3396372.1 response regulator [Chitinivibrionales bacterium]